MSADDGSREFAEQELHELEVRIRNLTPHSVDVTARSGAMRTFPAESKPARLKESAGSADFVTVDGEEVRLRDVELGPIFDLPEEQPGTLLIVSRPVAMASPERCDLVFPGEVQRDQTGQPTYALTLDRLGRATGPETPTSTERSRRSAARFSEWWVWIARHASVTFALGVTLATAAGGIAIEQGIDLVGARDSFRWGVFAVALAVAGVGGLIVFAARAAEAIARRRAGIYVHLTVFDSKRFGGRYRVEGECASFARWASKDSRGFGSTLVPLERTAGEGPDGQRLFDRSAAMSVADDAALSLRQAGLSIDQGADTTMAINATLFDAFVCGRELVRKLPDRRPPWVAVDKFDHDEDSYLRFSAGPPSSEELLALRERPASEIRTQLWRRSDGGSGSVLGLSERRDDGSRDIDWGVLRGEAGKPSPRVAVAVDMMSLEPHAAIMNALAKVDTAGKPIADFAVIVTSQRFVDDPDEYRLRACEIYRVLTACGSSASEVHFFMRGPAALAFAVGLMLGQGEITVWGWTGSDYVPVVA